MRYINPRTHSLSQFFSNIRSGRELCGLSGTGCSVVLQALRSVAATTVLLWQRRKATGTAATMAAASPCSTCDRRGPRPRTRSRSVSWHGTKLERYCEPTATAQPRTSSTLASWLSTCCHFATYVYTTWVVGCWRGYLSGTRCRLAYGPADATATHCVLLQ